MAIKDTVLVIAAHPDDESLGMGGTIHRLLQAGHTLHVLFLSSGVGSRDTNREDSAARLAAANRALNLLGCSHISIGDFPDNSFDSIGLLGIAKYIESKVDEIQPNIIFTNFHSDLNVDEVLSSTGWQFGAKQFLPTYFIDISESISQKEAALSAYATEMDESPSARSYDSVKALARHRGNFIGFEYAEAFEVGFIRKRN
jgi:LmbE family N-acetylglucosaminyl deacetylase